jgi:hypothetical protein
MVDRTLYFLSRISTFEHSIKKNYPTKPTIINHSPNNETTSSSFSTHTLWLNREIDNVAEQVRIFRLESFKTTTGIGSLTQSANMLKDRIKELEIATKTIKEATSAMLKGGNLKTGTQEVQHMDKVLSLLEQKLVQVASDFRWAFDKRAKIVTSRNERQENLFGESKLHMYASSFTPSSSNNAIVSNSNNNSAKNKLLSHSHQQQNMNGNIGHTTTTNSTSAATSTSTTATNDGLLLRHRRAVIHQPLLPPTTTTTTFDNNNNNNHFDNNNDENNNNTSQQQQQQRQIHSTRVSHESTRSQDIKRVEKMVSELGQMFMRVAGMVKEQGEMLDDIEMNVDDTIVQTEEAQTQLLKLFKFVSGDRSLIIKLFIVITILGMIIIYFWT